MKFSLFLSFVTSFFLSLGFAQELETSLLWEITGKKVKSPSYIFGTMHLIPKDKFYFPEELTDKLITTEVLIMEIGGITSQLSSANMMFLKEGNVFDFFNHEQQDSIFSYLKEEMNLSQEEARKRFGRLKPLALMQILTKNSFGEQPESYELRLEFIAQKHGLEIQGFETVEEQMAIFDKISYAEQAEMVMTSLRENDSLDVAQKLIAIYLSQDVDAIASFIHGDASIQSMDFQYEFINKRNQNWIPLIQKSIRKKKCFIAVGAGHLGGPEGVIELLRTEGYTLKPIQF